MSTYVQVMPLVDEDGQPCWTTTEGAEYFGVYVGHPGAFEWLADVPQRESAMRIAYGIAANEGIPRENVYLVGEEVDDGDSVAQTQAPDPQANAG